MDFDGNIYVADTGNHCIRRINEVKRIETQLVNGIPLERVQI